MVDSPMKGLGRILSNQIHDRDDKIAAMITANQRIGKWLSAALDDPNVCADMKADIAAWFDSQKS